MPAVAEGGGAGCSQMALNIDGLGSTGLTGVSRPDRRWTLRSRR